jgi:negative regulator of flagellin synthesis FlgM
MKITSDGHEIAKYMNETAVRQTKEATEKAPNPNDVPAESQQDTVVKLSERSIDVRRAQEVIQSEPDIRSEKVQAIKDKIEKGTYEIDFDKTAEKMVKAFFDNLV